MLGHKPVHIATLAVFLWLTICPGHHGALNSVRMKHAGSGIHLIPPWL